MSPPLREITALNSCRWVTAMLMPSTTRSVILKPLAAVATRQSILTPCSPPLLIWLDTSEELSLALLLRIGRGENFDCLSAEIGDELRRTPGGACRTRHQERHHDRSREKAHC